jgi:hypothetical protein
MAVSTIFKLKLFRETTASFTKAVKATDPTVEKDTRISNKLNLLEARKFMNEINITKKLNEYKRISTVLEAKVKAKADGTIENDNLPAGFMNLRVLYSIL